MSVECQVNVKSQSELDIAVASADFIKQSSPRIDEIMMRILSDME